MTSEEPRPDGAVAETAGAASPEGDAGEPGSTKDKWRQALDRYLENNLAQALALVDEILKEDPHTELRPRLERLKRRALDRIERPEEGEAAASAGQEATAPTPEAPAQSQAPPPAAEVVAPPEAGPPSAPVPEPTTPTTAVAPPPEAASPPPASPPPSGAAAAVIDAPSEGKAPSEAAPAEARAKDSAQDLDVVGGEVGEVEAAGPAPVAESLSAPAPAEPAKAAPRRTTPAPGAILRRPVSPGGVAQKRTNVGAPAPAAPAPAVNGKELEKVQSSVAELGKVMRGIESSMVRIAEAYQRVAKDGKRKDQAYDQLYEELRQYKDDWLLNAQKPLFRDVVLLYDSIARQLANFEQVEGAQLPREAVLGALKHLRDEVLEVLYRRDVERIEDTPPKLTIDFQKPVRRVDTDDPEQDRDVTQVLRDGFRLRGAVLRPQEVVVKRHVGSAGSGGTPSAAAEATPKERESP